MKAQRIGVAIPWRDGRMERGAVLLACLACFMFAGCGGQPARDSSGARTSGVVQKRGGAYYKDDGPADEIPRDLDSIPDARPRLERLHRGANRPYVVLGKSYVPNTTLKPVRERGIASWYGKKFHGQKTSIGEPYDMFAMTAAHPTLVLPSYARVTNLDNGKSVVVRVIDRGPFHADRIIDLSYAAAYRLGYINAGRARVEVETLLPTDSTSPLGVETPPPRPAAAQSRHDEFERLVTQLARETNDDSGPPSAKGVFLQLGAFSSADNAESLRARLARELDWLTEGIRVQAGDGIYRVRLGPYGSRAEASTVAERIRATLGYPPGFVVR